MVVSPASHLLAVVFDQETELQPTEIMTDTAGYTDTILGIFHLLGLQFSPLKRADRALELWPLGRRSADLLTVDLTHPAAVSWANC